jgi:hypothetical protein
VFFVITRDYFLRMIHQLAHVLAKVLNLSQLQRYDDALEEVQLSSRQLLGMDLRLLTTLSNTEFIRLLSLGDRFDVEKCVVAAELLQLVGEVKELEGEEGVRFHCTTTSLSLFLELLIRESGVLPKEYHDKIELLIGKLSTYELPVGLQAKLFRYYEAIGRFDAAENVLFDVVQQDATFIVEGLKFYERLRAKSAEELERGNLPRDEVEASVKELEKRMKKH